MPCYFKNSRMTELFEALDVEVNKENREVINETLQDYLSVNYKNCTATWKVIRKRLKEDGKGFKNRLKDLLQPFR